MKRPIFFIVSAILVLVLLVAWVYVLFFSDSSATKDTILPNFPFGEDADATIPIAPSQEEAPVIDLTSQEKLRQLTLGPVIGFQEVQKTPSSTLEIYYSTAGTGHVYSINLLSGEEKRISGTTILSARKSVVTPDGSYVLTQSGRGGGSNFFVSPLDTGAGNAPLEIIQEQIIDFSATTDNTFLYATKVGNNLVVREFFPISRVDEEVFTIPFQEAVIVWGKNALDTHFVYPKTSTQLEGYLYMSQQGNPLKRITPNGFGFSAIGNDTYAVYSAQKDGDYQSNFYNITTNIEQSLPVTALPQKCTLLFSSNKIICATDSTKHNNNTPDSWHQGTMSYTDNIIEIDLDTRNITFLSDTLDESGREIDIINPATGRSNMYLYFRNKNDQTLWLYERDQEEEIVMPLEENDDEGIE